MIKALENGIVVATLRASFLSLESSKFQSCSYTKITYQGR